MSTAKILAKLNAYKKNPDAFQSLSNGELADLVIVVLSSVNKIDQAIKEGRLDGKTPVKDEEYLGKETAIRIIKETLTEASSDLKSYANDVVSTKSVELDQKVSESIARLRDGEDGIVTDEEIERAASVALSMLELPDFDALVSEKITTDGGAIRNALELLQGDERYEVEIADVKGLGDALKNLTQLRTSNGGAGIGKQQVYSFIRQAIADGTISTGGVSDEAYGPSWDGVTDEGASKNAIYDKIETLAGGHDPVTVTDSAEIDFTLTGQDITAALKAGSIDETKLDASVNVSLGKADTALQPSDKTGTDAEVVSGTAGTAGNFSKWNADGDLVDTVIKEVRVANQMSSGLILGGQLSINANPALFDISNGNGVIVDNVTNPEVPVIYNVSWTGLTAQTVTNLATQSVTHVYIDNTGAIFQASTAPTPTERRAYIYLGQLGHTSNTSIGAAIPSPDLFVSPVAQIRDLEQSLGVISTGNIITANGANLSIDKSVGTLFSNGINFFADDSNPSNKTYASQIPVSMRLRTQTGNGSTTTTLDVGNYDLAGTITAIGPTKAQNFRVYLTTGGNVVVQYGQTLYNSLAAAASGLQSETFVRFPNLGENSILIGIISVMSNATDLSLATDAKFYNVSKFGEVGGAAAGVSVSTLQNVYNNSTSPEILTNSILGAVTVKRGSAADTDTVMEVQNAAGTVTQSVTGNGLINSAALTASELAATDASKNIVSLPVATYPSLAETAHVKGVTSAIQTQLDAKAPTASPTFTGILAYDAARGKVTAGGNLSTTETINFNSETNYTGTLDANITFTFANATSGDDVTLYLTYSGAQRTITWPTVTWLDNATGAAPTTPAASGNVLVVTVRYIGTTYYASATGNYAAYA